MHCHYEDLNPKKNKKADLSNAPRRGLSRIEAARYIGVSPSLFDEMVKDGRMPQPIRINGRVVWDIKDLDDAFERLKEEPDANSWDEM
jgi:predicted DNA-binding transcriptional regulator AlpA